MITKREKAAIPDHQPLALQEPVGALQPKTAAARSHSSHPEYPLERVCSYLSEPFQLTFARNAQQYFSMREDVELIASHRGLTIRGETEDAIDAALVLLKDLYGPRI